MIFWGIVMLGFGIWMTLLPGFWLQLEDLFRIRGDREYSDAAYAFMRLRGIIVMIGGIIVFFI